MTTNIRNSIEAEFNKFQTRNQHASPPRGNAIPAGHVQNLSSDSGEILCR